MKSENNKIKEDTREIVKILKEMKRDTRKIKLLNLKGLYIVNHISIRSVAYLILCMAALVFAIVKLHAVVIVIILIYFISILNKPNILLVWDIENKWPCKYKLFPVSLFVMTIFSNIFFVYIVGIILLGSNSFTGFLFIISFMTWFSILDYVGKLNAYQIEQYIFHLVNETKQENNKRNRRDVLITFIGSFSKHIYIFNYRLLLQIFRILFVVLVVLYQTLDLRDNVHYSYFEMFDKAVVISIAIDAICKLGCEKIQKNIDSLRNGMSKKIDNI